MKLPSMAAGRRGDVALAIEPIWFEWLTLGGVLVFGGWLLGVRGVWALRLSSDPTGLALVIIVLFVASCLWCGARSRELQRQRRLLKTPLAVGTSWQASTTTCLMRRNADFPPEIRHTHKPVPMTYRIEALDEKLSTRAGSFNDCLRLRGQAVLRLFADPVVGLRDMPISTTDWYCKGEGLVKVQRDEPAKSSFLIGGVMTLELTEWQ